MRRPNKELKLAEDAPGALLRFGRMVTMNCPDCGSPMSDRSVLSVTVDECTNCHGVWFDRGELAPYLRRIRKDPARGIPSDAQFRLHYEGGAASCSSCAAPHLRAGVFQGLRFLACSSCSGVFLPAASIRLILENDHTRTLRRAASGKGVSAVDALVWTLLGGEEGLLAYLVIALLRDNKKHIPDN